MTIQAQLNAVQAVATAIMELERVPSGHLYAQLCGAMDFRAYESLIALLKRTKLVTEENLELVWVVPKLK